MISQIFILIKGSSLLYCSFLYHVYVYVDMSVCVCLLYKIDLSLDDFYAGGQHWVVSGCWDAKLWETLQFRNFPYPLLLLWWYYQVWKNVADLQETCVTQSCQSYFLIHIRDSPCTGTCSLDKTNQLNYKPTSILDYAVFSIPFKENEWCDHVRENQLITDSKSTNLDN